MYQPLAPHNGRTALIYGLSGGIGMGIIQSLIIVGLRYGISMFTYAILAIPLSCLLWLVLFMLAGVFAAKQTGKVSTGTLTGLWAGLAGGLITSVALFFSTWPLMFSPYNTDPSYLASTAALFLTYMIFMTLFMLGVGTGLGALGGLIGQSFSSMKALPFAQQQPPMFMPQQAPFGEGRTRDPEPPYQVVENRQRDPEPPNYPAQ